MKQRIVCIKMAFCDLRELARKLASPFGHPTRVCLFVEGRGSRVTSRGSRVNSRGSRVNGRGSRVTSRGLKNFDNYFLTSSNRNFVFPVSVLFYIKPSGIM